MKEIVSVKKISPDELIKKRADQARDLFFIDETIVWANEKVEVRKKKKFYGIYLNGTEIFPIVFDEVSFIGRSFFEVRILHFKAIADVASKRLSSFDYAYFEILSDQYVKAAERETSKEGVLAVDGWRIILPFSFDEVGRFVQPDILWVRNGNCYDYVNVRDGRIMNVCPLRLVYDNVEGMAGLNGAKRVVALGQDGRVNGTMLREMVMEAGGHLVLQNYKEKIEHIIDVYGNILNI